MFAISQQDEFFSPIKMKFQDLWIYNLQNCHEYWKDKVKQRCPFHAGDVWTAVLKAHSLSIFSSLSELQNFAFAYHQEFNTKESSTKIKKVFEHLRRMGIHKIGHLRNLESNQIQRRWGKTWRVFFDGVLSRSEAKWPWKSHKDKGTLKKSFLSDELICDAQQIFDISFLLIRKIENETKNLYIDQIKLELISGNSSDDQELYFYFPQKIQLNSKLSWMESLLKEKIFHTELLSPIGRIDLELQVCPQSTATQLKLFETQKRQLQWENVCNKLKIMGFDVFQPELCPSYLPEQSWQKSKHIVENFRIEPHTSLRPLIQEPPKNIQAPSGKLYFTERIQNFDFQGRSHYRDYYITRLNNQWVWVFKDEKGSFYQQGVAE